MTDYHCLVAQVGDGNGKLGLLYVSAKLEEHFYLLCDGPVLIQGPIYIVDGDWLGQRGCFQVVFPDEMAPNEHPGGP